MECRTNLGIYLEGVGGQFLLTTRSHDQYNTPIYGLDDRYRRIFNGRRAMLLNADDVKERGWEAGAHLDITSYCSNNGNEELRKALRFVAVPYDIPHRCAATYFPEANVVCCRFTVLP